MARLARTTADYHQDHLRRLIDQRAARADLPDPSPHFADTPSIYSPSIAVFSPYSQGDGPISRYTASNTMQSPESDSSMLDLDDDSQTSTCSAPHHHHVDDSFQEPDYDDEDEDDDEDDDDYPNRMSLLGPKMRFHSRAPWETGEDMLPEEEEPIPSPTYDGAIAVSDHTPSRMPNIEGIKKGFRFGSVKPARGSEDSESSRSQGKYKRSFETASSHTSQNSLSLKPSLTQLETPTPVPPPSPHSIFRNRFTSNKNTNTPPLTPTASSPSSDVAPSADHLRFCSDSPVPWISADRRPSASTLPIPTTKQHTELVHPYANPDLVVTSVEDPLPLSSNLAEYSYSNASRSEARITPTKSISTSSSRSTNTITPASSTSSFRDQNQERVLRSRSSNIQGKEISSPIPVNSPVLDLRSRDPKHPDATTLPGWYNNAAPSFNLISLEEARAQRSRSTTSNAAIRPSQSTEFPAHADTHPGSFGNDSNGPMVPNPRMRSTSAGMRPKILGEGPISSDSQAASPQGSVKPALKHKKSGFLRIFNSKEKEREKERPRTPPPALDDHILNAQPRPHDFPKLVARVPVPPISPRGKSSTDTSPSIFVSNSSSLNDRPSPVSSPQKLSPSPRRIFPSTLSISTASSPSQSSRVGSFASSEKRYSSWVATPPSSDVDMVPQSAPALVTDFPALKLRPVSTMFSAHFQDHLINGPESEDPDNIQSPKSSGTRPLTPGSFSRSDSTNLGPIVISSDDPASVIQSLQNQVASVRKAWQLEIWDLEGQVRDLKAQVEDMRASEREYCETCGRGRRSTDPEQGTKPHGIVNRPRARTGTTSRFANGG